MTVYLSDFDDHENWFSENSLSDFEHDCGFAAEIEQWRGRSFRLRHNIELLIATDEYCNRVIDCSGYGDKPFILHESTFSSLFSLTEVGARGQGFLLSEEEKKLAPSIWLKLLDSSMELSENLC